MTGMPTLVMIPGTLCDARIFWRPKRMLRGLAKVCVIDYGDMDRVEGWAQRLLQRLPARFSVAGFSLGGLWALELLRLAPQRVERIALIASNAHGASPAGRRKSEGLRKLWHDRGPVEVARHVKAAYFHHAQCRRRHSAMVLDMARGTSRKAAFAEFDFAAKRPDGHAALAQFAGPLLLISGAQDRLCTSAMQRSMLLAQPAANWIELPRAGHFLPLEAPVRLGHALRNWMQCGPT